jgi:O-antigen/teichoic acid export membrane protein
MDYFSKTRLQELFLSSGFQKYLKNASWLLLSRILCMGISFAATAFIARHLGPSNYGQLSYAVSFVSIFSFLPSLGIDNVLYRDLIKYPEKRNEYLGSAIALKITASTITAIIIIIAAVFFAQDDVSKILIIILSFMFIFNSFLLVNNEFQANVQSKYPSIISLTVTIILNILKIIVVYLDKGVIYLAFILLLETVLYAVMYLLAYTKILNKKILAWRFNKVIAVSLLKDSLPLIFSYAFVLIYSRVDQVLIKHMMNAAAVGIYDSAVRVAEVWYFIPSIIISSVTPAIVNAKSVSERLYNSRLRKLILFVLLITVMTSLITSLLSSLIIKVLYGNDFSEGIKILQIYVWTGISVSLSTLSVSYLTIERSGKFIFYSTFIPMIINVILNILWIPTYGITGSAYATLLSYSLGPISLLFFKNTRLKILTIFKT